MNRMARGKRLIMMFATLGLIFGSLTVTAPASAIGSFSNGAIADRAELRAEGQWAGQCKAFVNQVVSEASAGSSTGTIYLSGYQAGFASAGGVEVSAANAVRGDIIQVTPAGSNDATAEGLFNLSMPSRQLHTAVILTNNGGGSFGVIDSNSAGYPEQVHRHSYNPYTSAAGSIIKIWRLGTVTGAGGVTRDVNADGRADLVVAGVGPSTSSGKLETHTLSGAGNYGSWLSHWVTTANYLGPNDRLVMGDVNADGRSDLVIVGTAGTGSGKLEVHALSGATGFSTWIGHWATPAGYLGANDRLAMADVNHDDRADLIIMATGPTGSGKFEAHVLNGNTGFGSWLGNWITASNYSGSGDRQLAGDVNGDGKAEILIIGIGPSTGSGKIEVHALNGATNYGSWLGHWVTAAGYLGVNDRLVMGDVNGDGKSDLVIVGTSGTGSGMLEVHALNAATNYSTWLGHWVSTSSYTGGTDVILMGG